MNKVILMGRLTADPDIRSTAEGMTVATFTLAVDRRAAKSEQTADFIRCVAFSKKAEIAERYYYKGIKILLTGRIQTGSYTNREGQKVYTTDVIAEDLEFAESRGASQANAASAPEQAPEPGPDGFVNVPDFDPDLPFS
jgi:single-strand DNA-binding protein